MQFQNFLDEAWAKHDKQTAEMVKQYELGLQLAQNENDFLALSRLITHVAAEHDFKYEVALHYLEIIEKKPELQTDAGRITLNRQITTMKYIQDQTENISEFSVADRAIIFITAATSWLYREDTELSEKLLQKAISASYALKAEDAANRPLAIFCNNMAAQLSEKKEITAIEMKMMIDLAHYSRNFWEKAGTWLEVERAEYYLSKYYRLISDLENSKKHAELCLKICTKEKAEPLEMFFAHESFALIAKENDEQAEFQDHLAQMKIFIKQASEKDQAWMQDALNKAEQ